MVVSLLQNVKEFLKSYHLLCKRLLVKWGMITSLQYNYTLLLHVITPENNNGTLSNIILCDLTQVNCLPLSLGLFICK